MIKRFLLLPFLFAFIGLSFYLGVIGKVSTPEATVNELMLAMHVSDLSHISEIGLRRCLDKRILAYGGSKYKELIFIFDEIMNKGKGDYDKFLQKIRMLGKSEFRKLSKEEAMIVQSSVSKERFIMEAGIKKLSSEDRGMISDVEKFIKGEEKDVFCIREGLQKISHEKWEMVKGYNYSDLKNQRMRFIRDEGEKIVKEEIQKYYKDVKPIIGRIDYIGDTPGSLFKSCKIRMEIQLKRPGDTELIGKSIITLARHRNNWLIESVYPPLF